MTNTLQNNIELLELVIQKNYSQDLILNTIFGEVKKGLTVTKEVTAETPTIKVAKTLKKVKPNRGGWTPERRARQAETVAKRKASLQAKEEALVKELPIKVDMSKPKAKVVKAPKKVLPLVNTKDLIEFPFKAISDLDKMIYHKSTKIMNLSFKSGEKKSFYEVPEVVAKKLIKDIRPKAFYNMHINGKYNEKPTKVAVAK